MIPKILLGKCGSGGDDYNLNIINMPVDEDAPEFIPVWLPSTRPKKGCGNSAQLDLFGMESAEEDGA